MLWYKGWLETRGRILFALIYAIFPIPLFLAQRTTAASSHPSLAALQHVVGFLSFYWAAFMPPVMLAGSGIKTQTFQRQKGVHGSMLYTLSLPASRLRLFLTRAGLGFSELVAVLLVAPFAVLAIFPGLRPNVTSLDLFKYWLSISVCGAAFYSIGVFFSTFLDDLTQNWASMGTVIILWGVLPRLHLPAPLNIFQAMGEGSPLFTHTLTWAPMGVAVAGAAVLCTAAFMVVRARQY